MYTECITKNQQDIFLAKKIQNNNVEAYSRLYRAYYKPLCRFAHRYVREPEVVEDIVQDVFLRVWEKRKNWNPESNVKAYLYRSVYHQVINSHRSRTLELAEYRDSENRIIDNGRSPLEELHHRETGEAIKCAIKALPGRRKEILVLRLLHGLTYREIGLALGISTNTVGTQVRRAMNHLRCQLRLFVL